MGRGGNGDGELDVGRMRSSGSSRKKPTPVQLQRDVVRLEDGLLEVYEWVVNPNRYKMARPSRGPIGGIARRAAKRETKD